MREHLRILQVVNVRWFNATAWYGLFLSRLLKEAGHDVRVLGLPGTESFTKARSMGLDPVGMNLNTVNPLELAQCSARLVSLVRGFRPDIVNCHRGEGMVLWGMLKPLGNFALVRTRGDQRPPKANLPNRILHNHIADAVIATNSRTAEECRALLHTPQQRIHTILGGVDTNVFTRSEAGRAAVRQKLGFADDTLVVGLLGRFDTVKGQRELLEAVARIRQAGATPGAASCTAPGTAGASAPQGWQGRIRIMLMGFATSVAQETVQSWITRYGLDDCTVITGKVPDVAEHISAMDLGVIASQGSEAIARAAFEIMNCGVPLVGTTVGVMPDLLPEWALVPPADPTALAQLLEKALSDSSFQKALQEAAWKRMQNLSEQDFLAQTLRVYRSVLPGLTG